MSKMSKQELVSMVGLCVTTVVSLAFWFGQVMTYAINASG